MSFSPTHTHFIDLPNNCSCMLPPDHRGTSGWHMRPINDPHSKARNFEVYERCQAYCEGAGLTIDPLDRRKLVAPEKTRKTRGVRA